MAESFEHHGAGPPFNPDDHGLWKSFITAGAIDHGRWSYACAAGDFVGTCRHCGGYLAPSRPREHGTRIDYEAQCVSCAHPILAPNGKAVRGSAALSKRRE